MKLKVLSIALVLAMVVPVKVKAENFVNHNQDIQLNQSNQDYEYERTIELDTLNDGDKITDIIGYGQDKQGNDYNFNFMNDIEKIDLSVDNSSLTITKINENTYGFKNGNNGNNNENAFQYKLTYYPNGNEEIQDEYFVLESQNNANKSIKFSYKLQLENPQTNIGRYEGLQLSNKTTLNGDTLDVKDTTIFYDIEKYYTVEHQYYTCTLDNPTPTLDGSITSDPIKAETDILNVESLQKTSYTESELDPEYEDMTDIIVKDNPIIDDGDPDIEEDDPSKDDGWDWNFPWWPDWLPDWRPRAVQASTYQDDLMQYGHGHAYGSNGEDLAAHFELSVDSNKNKIVIKYYRTSYRVEHKYYTSTNQSPYQLDGVVKSKEYAGLEGELIKSHNILTKVRYENNLYQLYRYGDDIVLAVNPSLNTIVIEYRRDVTDSIGNKDDILGGKDDVTVKPIPPLEDKPIHKDETSVNKKDKPKAPNKENIKEQNNLSRPETGDDTNIGIYAGAGLLALIIMFVLFNKKKK